MTLIDSDTGEELCISNATYGKGSRGAPIPRPTASRPADAGCLGSPGCAPCYRAPVLAREY